MLTTRAFLWFFFRAFVYLTNLLHGVTLVQNVTVVSEHGDIKGYLKIGIEQLPMPSTTTAQETTSEQIKLMRTYRNVSGLAKITFDDETYFQVSVDVLRTVQRVIPQLRELYNLQSRKCSSSIVSDTYSLT